MYIPLVMVVVVVGLVTAGYSENRRQHIVPKQTRKQFLTQL